MSRASWAARSLPLGVLLLAFGLRIYRLDFQSLWFDEAGSLYWATHGLNGLTGDFNPPAYYSLLAIWVRLTGQSELALRYLSLLPSVASVALLFAVARRSASAPVALGAAAVLATSPFGVYYAQEARMYSLALALALLIAWLAPVAAHDRRAAVVYAVTGAAGLLTHYFFVIPLGLAAAWWAVDWLRRRTSGSLPRLVVSHAAIGLACLPWALYVSGRALARNDFWRVKLPPDELALDLLRSFAFGEAWLEHFDRSWLITLAIGLGLTGLLWRRSRLATAGAAGVLVAAWAAVALAPQPVYTARYLIVVLPAFALLLAGVLGAVPPKLAVAPGLAGGTAATLAFIALLAALHVPPLATLYGDSRYQRDDYRTLAARLQPLARPDDPVVYLAGRMDLPFRYYFGGAGPDLVLDDSRRYLAGDRSPALEALLHDDQVDRVWLVRSIAAADFINDPDHTVAATFLESGATPTADVAVKGLVAVLYEKASWRGRDVAASIGARFGDALVLDGASVTRDGDSTTASLYWQSRQAPGQPLSYSVQAIADGRLVAQRDGRVGGEFAGALATPGGRQRDVVELDVPADIAIEIAVAVYSAGTGQRLATAGDYGFSPNLVRIATLPSR